jgi:hypothetical protein
MKTTKTIMALAALCVLASGNVKADSSTNGPKSTVCFLTEEAYDHFAASGDTSVLPKLETLE